MEHNQLCVPACRALLIELQTKEFMGEGAILAPAIPATEPRDDLPLLAEQTDVFVGGATPKPEKVDRLLTDIMEKQKGAGRLAAALVPYICEKLLSPHSIKSYARDLQFFERRMRNVGKQLLQVTADDLKIYKRTLIEAGYRTSAVAHKLTVLRRTYQQWADKGFISWETVRAIQAVEAPPVTKNNTPALTEEQAILLLESIPLHTPKGLRDFAMTSTYFVTACRASAITNARVGDLEESGGNYYLHVTEKRKHDARKNLLHTAEPLLTYMEVAGIRDDLEGPLFRPMTCDRSGFERRHMDRKLPWRLVKYYCRKAGINPDRPKGPGVGIHSLRKTAANNAKENGAAVHEIQELLGHKSVMTTEAYFETNEMDGENAARRIQIRPPFDQDGCYARSMGR